MHETSSQQTQSCEMLVCQICGRESHSSLISHITRTHSIFMHIYREKFPGCAVQRMSDKQRSNLSSSHKERLKDPAEMQKFKEWRSSTVEIKHWTRKGMSVDEAKRCVSDAQRSFSLRGNNEATKRKRSEKNAGNHNPMSLQNIAKRHGVGVDAASALTPCYGRRGSLHPMFGKKHTDEALKKMGEKINSSRVSQAEHSLTDKLVNKHGGGKNLGVGGWSCDYVHADRKIIVEFFGDFWHHNPDIYDDSWINPFTMRTTAAVRERDQKKIKELQELGYVVIVVWEKEWKSNQKRQLKRIDDAFNQL